MAGYADYNAHGINGFLFDTNEQANLILRLRDDASLRERIGRAARQSVEDLYRSRAWRRKLDFLLPREDDARPARLLGRRIGSHSVRASLTPRTVIGSAGLRVIDSVSSAARRHD